MAFKILLADDSVTAQNLAKKILTDVGYDVVAVSNGAAAMKKISAEHPDLLILDVYMPGYSGLEVCEKIKGVPETASTPVLLTVAPMEPYNPADGNRVRADGVILKPFEARDLVPAVEKLQEQTLSSQAASVPAAVEDRKLGARTAAQGDPNPAQEEPESECLPGERRPVPMPELPQEMAVAPAFGLEQFGSEPDVSPAETAVNLAELRSSVADSPAETFGALEIMEAELVSQSLEEFDLLEQGLPEESGPGSDPASEMSYSATGDSFPGTDPEEDSSSRFQSELEIDAANASLGELGFASGLAPQAEPSSSADLDLSPEAFSAENFSAGTSIPEASEHDSDEVAPGQDPELMVDRTQMVDFATQFGSDTAEDVPVGIASVDKVDEAEAVMGPLEEASAEDAGLPEFDAHAVAQEDSPQEEQSEFQEDASGQDELKDEQQSEVELAETDSMAVAEFESATASPVEEPQSEPGRSENNEEVEEVMTPPETATLESEPDAEQELAFEMSVAEEQELPAIEWSTGTSFAKQDEGQVDAAFSPMDASQFFQPESAAAPELDAADPETTWNDNTVESTELDEHALEEAVGRVLDRLRPQILSELVRELNHH